MRVRVSFAIAFCAALFFAGIVVGVLIQVVDNALVRYQRDVIAEEAHSSLGDLLSTAEELEAACYFLYEIHEELAVPKSFSRPPDNTRRVPIAVEAALALDDVEVEVDLTSRQEFPQPQAAVSPIQLPEDYVPRARGPGAF